jgi:cardiolipin synthase
VLIDDVGSGYAWQSVFKKLNENGVPVAYFLPTHVPWRIAFLNLRNHRKILTIDGAIAFTGGLNIHENHVVAGRPEENAVQDLHFRIEGPVVVQIQDVFRVDWRFTTGEELAGPAWYPVLIEKGPMLARGIADGPDEDFENCRWAILAALAHAQKSIRIITPYLVPDQALIAALNQAALSGVKVDIALPMACDMKTVQWATHAGLPQILYGGCRVWEIPPPFNHAKLMVVDSEWTFFGSTNWDARSLRLNFEFNVECYDAGLAQKMEAWTDEKIAGASAITLESMNARPWLIKLRDGAARLFAPIL